MVSPICFQLLSEKNTFIEICSFYTFLEKSSPNAAGEKKEKLLFIARDMLFCSIYIDLRSITITAADLFSTQTLFWALSRASKHRKEKRQKFFFAMKTLPNIP